MIKITFTHWRNIAKNKDEFKPWVRVLFPSAKFDGFEYGWNYPTLQIPLSEWEAGKDNIPNASAKNIVKIEGEFSFFEQIVFGVRDFSNDLRIIQ